MQEMLGLSASVLYATEENRRGVLAALKQDGGVRDRIGQGRKKDGSLFWVSLNARLFKNEQDQIAGAECFVRDITERKQAEEALRTSEERYRNLFDAGPYGIVLIGRDGCVTEANLAQARLHGLGSTAELVGMHATLLVAPSSRDYSAQVMARRLNGEDVPPVEYHLVRKDGTTFCAEASATILRDASGAVSGYICVTRDISESKRAEEELRDRLQFETLMADLSARFVTVDAPYVDREIEAALRRICDCLDMDVAAIWQAPDANQNAMAMTHLHRRTPGPPVPAALNAKDFCPWTIERLRTTGATLLVSGLTELPQGAARDREVYAQFGIANAVSVPFMTADGALSGVVSFNNTREKALSRPLVARLETTARLLLALLARARAERTMAAGRERMRLLTEMLDEAPAGVMVHDEGGSVLYANEYAAALHGYQNDDLSRLNVADLVAPDARAKLQQNMRETLERGETAFDIWHARKDRSAVHLHVVARRTMWLDRPAILSVQTDLTERERSAKALRESEERYRLLAEGAADVVWVLDPMTRTFLYVSPSVERLLGFTAEEAMALTLDAFLAPQAPEGTADKAYEQLRGLASGAHLGRFGTHVVHQMRKDGSSVPTEVAMESIRDQATGKILVRGVSRDITERIQAENARQELQAQLNQSQKMEAIGSLAGGVAHDFNNLLSVILNYTAFAMEAAKQNEALEADLTQVTKAAYRAISLTRQLLAFSRKQVLQPVPLSLNQIAVGLEKMLGRILGEDIDFVQELAPDLGLTLADPGQIEQVMMNLVVNARDAMPDGGTLTIQTANMEVGAEQHAAIAPGRYVRLAVTDTGTGMDERTRQRIFEPFFTTKEKGKGTGLGLSTAFGIIKQSGGDIRVSSEPGRGTTFEIFLPRDLSATTTATMVPRASKRTKGSETILVVEDEEALRAVAKRGLTAAGYTVLTAADGPDALRISAEHEGEIHLLVTDVVMPHMNGKALADRLANDRPKTKVLYMSGYTDDAIVRHGVLNPGIWFINKPFTAADLTTKVREVLDSIASAGATSTS
jgi:two-component system, cell cycle sensor histidine kinase and response regulator CckA